MMLWSLIVWNVFSRAAASSRRLLHRQFVDAVAQEVNRPVGERGDRAAGVKALRAAKLVQPLLGALQSTRG